MGFPYVEPSIEELNARIAGGEVYVQSSLSGIYREYFAQVLPEERAQATIMPEVSLPFWNQLALESSKLAPTVYAKELPSLPSSRKESVPVYYGQSGTPVPVNELSTSDLGAGLGVAVLALMALYSRSKRR